MNDSLIQYNHLQKKQNKTLEKKTNTPRQQFTFLALNISQQSS